MRRGLTIAVSLGFCATCAVAQLSVEEEQKSFSLPAGFQIELVAAEPELPKPITIAFDDAGRMWTMTAVEYPVDANEQPQRSKELFEKGGRDRVLVFDTPTAAGRQTPRTFADGLAIPLGILPYRDGVIVQHGSEIVFLRDTNGDGKADKREVLLTGFGIQDSHLFPHGFTRGPGGWIYMAQGAFNSGTVVDRSGRKTKFAYCKLARFEPDGFRFEIVGWGLNNIWGFVITREGEMFIQEANDLGYPVVPFQVGANYPGIGMDRAKPYAPFQPPLAKFEMGGTGLSGLALSDGRDSFPAPWRDVMFLANPITRQIQAIKIHNDSAAYRLEKLSDFLSATDPMFRPIHIEFGPDGCLYIVDWYNKIISHNEVPRNHPDRDKTHGRIWRVRHKDQPRRSPPDLTRVAEKDLLAHLAADNTWEANAAWHQIEDRARDLIPEMRAIAEDSKQAADVRIRALQFLQERGEITDIDFLKKLVKDPNRNVRREAVRAVAGYDPYHGTVTLGFLLKRADAQVGVLEPLMDDPDPQVRAEVVRTLRRIADLRFSVAPLVLMAKPPLDGPTIRTQQENQLVKTGDAYDRDFERYLIRGALEEIPDVLAKFLDSDAAKKLPLENRMFAALALGKQAAAVLLAKTLPELKRDPTDEELVTLAQNADEPTVAAALATALKKPAALNSLIASGDRVRNNDVRTLLVAAARAQKDADLLVQIAAAFKVSDLEPDVIAFTTKTGQTVERQIAGLRALREMGSQQAELFARLAATDALQSEAVAALAATKSDQTVPLLLQLWPKLSPPLRKQAIDRLASNKINGLALVRAVAHGEIARDVLDAAAFDKLRAVLGNNPELAAIAPPQREVQSVLRLNRGNDDYVDTNLTLDGAFTVETWVKLDAGITNADGILGFPGGADFNFHDARLRVYGGPEHGDRIVARRQIAPEVWTHVAVTRNAAGQFRIYLDGELDNDQSNPLPQRFEHLAIGRTTPPTGTAGWLAEFRVWNVERTADEIRDNFHRSFEREAKPASLVFYAGGEQWGKLSGNARVEKTTDSPLGPADPVLKAKFEKFRALAYKGGDANAGKIVFTKTCAVCHSIHGEGGNVGPNLDGVGLRERESLLSAILTPSAAIEAGYHVFRLQMKDGDIQDGLLVSQDDNEIVLRQPNTQDQRILRAQIKSAAFTQSSMMPEGLLEALPTNDVANLFAYLRSVQPDSASLFNGKDLTGWDGNMKLWRVENDEIVGQATDLPRNEFLRSKLVLGDFRLIVKAKMVMQGKGFENSGIQFRTEPLADGEVRGYQADIGPGWWGKLYEENGRGILSDKSGEPFLKVNDWNTYEILAVGSKIRTALNGHVCADLDDPAGARKGIIAFQLHSGGSVEMHFKDFELEPNPKFELKTVK